ncbi:hypothetical protein RDWZM_009560 [Blomia tropicalis]|uniref:YLP motif-containing protein 1 n=1 Tax=Blomia tropicalis TaxID=40697 RepID=A0A9Q0M1N3_BLOTA|nr:hypothetical protein RDWZM_009560 [Blomia tropicalis]
MISPYQQPNMMPQFGTPPVYGVQSQQAPQTPNQSYMYPPTNMYNQTMPQYPYPYQYPVYGSMYQQYPPAPLPPPSQPQAIGSYRQNLAQTPGIVPPPNAITNNNVSLPKMVPPVPPSNSVPNSLSSSVVSPKAVPPPPPLPSSSEQPPTPLQSVADKAPSKIMNQPDQNPNNDNPSTVPFSFDAYHSRLTKNDRKEGWERLLDKNDRQFLEKMLLEANEFDLQLANFEREYEKMKDATTHSNIGDQSLELYNKMWGTWKKNLLDRRNHMLEKQEHYLAQLYKKVCQNFPLFLTKSLTSSKSTPVPESMPIKENKIETKTVPNDLKTMNRFKPIVSEPKNGIMTQIPVPLTAAVTESNPIELPSTKEVEHSPQSTPTKAINNESKDDILQDATVEHLDPRFEKYSQDTLNNYPLIQLSNDFCFLRNQMKFVNAFLLKEKNRIPKKKDGNRTGKPKPNPYVKINVPNQNSKQPLLTQEQKKNEEPSKLHASTTIGRNYENVNVKSIPKPISKPTVEPIPQGLSVPNLVAPTPNRSNIILPILKPAPIPIAISSNSKYQKNIKPVNESSSPICFQPLTATLDPTSLNARPIESINKSIIKTETNIKFEMKKLDKSKMVQRNNPINVEKVNRLGSIPKLSSRPDLKRPKEMSPIRNIRGERSSNRSPSPNIGSLQQRSFASTYFDKQPRMQPQPFRNNMEPMIDSFIEHERTNLMKHDKPYMDPHFFTVPRKFSDEPLYIKDLLDMPGRAFRPPRIVFIIRGLPGSGKSKLVRAIKEKEERYGSPSSSSAIRVHSLDDYFLVENDGPFRTEDDRFTFIYDRSLEVEYKLNLFKAFSKTLTGGFYNMVIVDSVNESIKDVRNLYACAVENNFIPYVIEMESIVRRILDDCFNSEEIIAYCYKNSRQGRTLDDIRSLYDNWELLSPDYLRVDAYSLCEMMTPKTDESRRLFSGLISRDSPLPLPSSPKFVSTFIEQDMDRRENRPMCHPPVRGYSRWENSQDDIDTDPFNRRRPPSPLPEVRNQDYGIRPTMNNNQESFQEFKRV